MKSEALPARHKPFTALARHGLQGAQPHRSSDGAGAADMVGLAALLVMGAGACAAWRIRRAIRLCAVSRVFEANPPHATARLLVVGDSTAVGTGATSPAASIAGLIARRHPDVAIDNRAHNGVRFADVLRQLDQPQAAL